MAIQFKDYYEILGVSPQADEDEVRRAFRKQARLSHPDITGNDRDAEDRFKEINEAYEVLGDHEKRRRYDEFNSAWRNESADEAWSRFAEAGPSSPPRPERFTFSGAGFSDFFEQLFGSRASSSGRPKSASAAPSRAEKVDRRGDDLEADLRVTLDEVMKGSVRQITMRRAIRCETCFGMGQVKTRQCETCKGAGSIPSTIACKVRVPAGIREGAFLRIPGKGDEGGPGSEPGDLFLKVCYGPHHDFHVENGNLIHELELAPWEAVLGTEVNVPTLDGHLHIKVPPGTQNGRKLRLKGRGLPAAEGGHGDLLVRVKIQVPDTARARERELWQELARESAFSPRDN